MLIMLMIYYKGMADVFSSLFALQCALRHMMPSENGVTGQNGQPVMSADRFCQPFRLVKTAKQPPFFA